MGVPISGFASMDRSWIMSKSMSAQFRDDFFLVSNAEAALIARSSPWGDRSAVASRVSGKSGAVVEVNGNSAQSCAGGEGGERNSSGKVSFLNRKWWEVRS